MSDFSVRMFDDLHPLDLANSTRRLPVVLCLDVSGSMRNAIDELREGVLQFIDECKNDLTARNCCELLILAFSETCTVMQHFDTIGNIVDHGIPDYPFVAEGYTATGETIRLALELLDDRRNQYISAGTAHYQPWLVVMSDGRPEGKDMNARAKAFDAAVADIEARVAANRLTVFSIGIGKHADEATMNRLSPGRPSVHLQGYKFSEFFRWLSSGAVSASHSVPGQGIPMQPITPWAEGWNNIGNAPQGGSGWNNKPLGSS